MYKFKDTTINTDTDTNLSSESLSYDGNLLEQLVSGFKVLTIEGRELIGNRISYFSIPGVDGEIIEDVTLPSRIIRATYALVADTNEGFREKFNYLNSLLNTRDKTDKVIRFLDEDAYFEGILESVDQPSTETNNVIGQMAFRCQKPFKYLADETTSGTISKIAPDGVREISYKIELVSITATAGTGSTMIIKNATTGERMILNNSFVAGQNLVITPRMITLDGANIASSLDYTSSIWKNFRLNAGDVITVTGGSNLKVTFRRCLL